MKELHTEIDIAAPVDCVWTILTDFAAFPTWNPFVTQAQGEIREGARLRVRIEPPGGRVMTFTPTVLRAAPGEELRWMGRLLLPGSSTGSIPSSWPPQQTVVRTSCNGSSSGVSSSRCCGAVWPRTPSAGSRR